MDFQMRENRGRVQKSRRLAKETAVVSSIFRYTSRPPYSRGARPNARLRSYSNVRQVTIWILTESVDSQQVDDSQHVNRISKWNAIDSSSNRSSNNFQSSAIDSVGDGTSTDGGGHSSD